MWRWLNTSVSKDFSITPAFIIMVGGAFVLLTLFSAPRDFPIDDVVGIEAGLSLDEIIEDLDEENTLRSPFAFKVLISAIGGAKNVQAGDYIFEERLSNIRLAWRITRGVYGLTQVRIRFPEGLTRKQAAEIFAEELDLFNPTRFLELTRRKEGFLFPDTYFFFVNATAEDVVTRLEETFKERIVDFEEDLAESEYKLKEIITMASIISREAHDPTDQKIISGVLWNRIDIGMALQADATLYYLLGKPSSELTKEDLKVDSPYNTYINPGLPPGPIGNPGVSAIDAALNPTLSDYLFYLSDSSGNTYFAEDFETHKENKRIYLNR